MSRKVDEILELLDHELQRSDESTAYLDVAPTIPDACFVCLGPPGDGPSGACASCREILLREEPREADEAVFTERWVRDAQRLPAGRLVLTREQVAAITRHPTFTVLGVDLDDEIPIVVHHPVATRDALRFSIDMGPIRAAFQRVAADIEWWARRLTDGQRDALSAIVERWRRGFRRPLPPVPAKPAHRRRFGR